MHLCLIEDDLALAHALSDGLTAADYRVQQVTRGDAGLHMLQSGVFDLAIVDLGLPGLSGMDLVQRLRQSGNNLPILMLTARDATQDRISGLDAGADDYLVKPFDFNELLARLRAIQRRVSGTVASVLQCGALRLDLATRQVMQAEQEIELSRREFALLQLLLENAGRVVTRDRLETALYGWLDPVASNALEVHVHHLRKKLGAETIRTMRGVGYLVVDSEFARH